jgi:hypothetical protein
MGVVNVIRKQGVTEVDVPGFDADRDLGRVLIAADNITRVIERLGLSGDADVVNNTARLTAAFLVATSGGESGQASPDTAIGMQKIASQITLNEKKGAK